MSGSPRIFIPRDIDESLERMMPPELRGQRKIAVRVNTALREYLRLKTVAGQAGTNEGQVAAAGDEPMKPASPGSR